MISWIDTTGTTMSQLVNQYRRHQNPDQLKELRDAVSTLAALIDEIDQRNW